MRLSVFFILCCAVIYFGGSYYIQYSTQNRAPDVFDRDGWVNPLNRMGISENAAIYKDNMQARADVLYVTVLGAAKDENGSLYNFADLLGRDAPRNGWEPVFEVYFRDDSKGIVDNSLFMRQPNATIELRGAPKAADYRKSFKLRLYDNEGLWNGQKIINLNKHYTDPLRIRNKLSFDYFSVVPDITSFRTRFVRLFIKDLSNKTLGDSFIDYGLFTQVEQPNGLFLTNHGLDPNAHLYEAESFKFLRYSESIKLKQESDYSKDKFEEILEIRGNDDHSKLIGLLEKVNDENIDINRIIDKHFDRENYLTWLAANILFDNYRVSDANFILYSPLNSEKWYFMPWDCEDSWGIEKERPEWQRGISMYWDNVLHRRFLRDPGNVHALGRKIEQLGSVVNRQQTEGFLDSYYNIVLSNIAMLPDLKYLPVTLEDYLSRYEILPDLVEKNRVSYHQLLEKPMPFEMTGPRQQQNKYIFTWEQSYDLQQDSLYYHFELSRDKSFVSSVVSVSDIEDTGIEVENLQPGAYYWRVTAWDTNGNWQAASNIYTDEFGDYYFGIKAFEIDKGSNIRAYE